MICLINLSLASSIYLKVFARLFQKAAQSRARSPCNGISFAKLFFVPLVPKKSV